MSDDFGYKPQPGDWDLPDEVRESLDPVSLALLSEGELEGVPVGVGFQASNDYGEVLTLVESDADPSSIMAKIHEVRTPWEQRYPGAIMWDRIHGHLAVRLAERGHVQESLDLLATVVSPYEQVARIDDIAEMETARDLDVNLLLASLLPEDDDAKRHGLMRAMRDKMIDSASDHDTVAKLDQSLADAGIEEDPVTGWIESRKIANTRLDWSYAEYMAGIEGWPTEMPAIAKRFVLLTVTEIIDQIDKGEIQSDVNNAIGVLDDFEGHYEGAEVWDHLRAGVAARAFIKNQPESGMAMAFSVRDPELIGSIAVTLATTDQQDAAVELAARNPNPKLAVELLLDIEWVDEEAGASKLSELVQDETEPKERRIAMMQAVRDRFTEVNALDMAVKWQDMIDELTKDN